MVSYIITEDQKVEDSSEIAASTTAEVDDATIDQANETSKHCVVLSP